MTESSTNYIRGMRNITPDHTGAVYQAPVSKPRNLPTPDVKN